MVCGKQFCLRNKKKKKKTSALCEDRTDQIKLRDLRAAYCTNEVLTKFRGNKYMFKHFSIFFSHESTKPKNYISLLIRVPHCFFPKENTRQTLRHILALIIYVCIYIYIYIYIYTYIYIHVRKSGILVAEVTLSQGLSLTLGDNSTRSSLKIYEDTRKLVDGIFTFNFSYHFCV